MKIYLIMLLGIVLFSCSTESPTPHKKFHKITFDLTKEKDVTNFQKWKTNNLDTSTIKTPTNSLIASNSLKVAQEFYQDSTYKVYYDCNGEFGGHLIFQNNQSQEVYHFLNSTCPIMLDLQKEGYYITSSLSHLMGHSSIYLVKDPSSLINVDIENFYTKNRFYDSTITGIDSLFQINTQNTEVILDTFNLLVNILYPIDHHLYVIYTDLDNTYLGQIEDQRIELIDTLLNHSTMGYYNKPNSIINDFYTYSYNSNSSIYRDGQIQLHRSTTGEIYIKGDSIIITYKHTKE